MSDGTSYLPQAVCEALNRIIESAGVDPLPYAFTGAARACGVTVNFNPHRGDARVCLGLIGTMEFSTAEAVEITSVKAYQPPKLVETNGTTSVWHIGGTIPEPAAWEVENIVRLVFEGEGRGKSPLQLDESAKP